jgi:acyl carrier protein
MAVATPSGSSSEIEAQIRAFLGEEVIGPEQAETLSVEDDLLARGVLNSLTLTRLVMFLEERFGLRVEPAEFEVDTFRSLGAIARFVAEKRRD